MGTWQTRQDLSTGWSQALAMPQSRDLVLRGTQGPTLECLEQANPETGSGFVEAGSLLG